jgi:hypothetical protein
MDTHSDSVIKSQVENYVVELTLSFVQRSEMCNSYSHISRYVEADSLVVWVGASLAVEVG